MKAKNPIMEECAECSGSGHTTYLHHDSREWGPDWRERECEACNGTGEVEHECPHCGCAHEEPCCPVCEVCAACCTCAVCWQCEVRMEGGDGALQWEDRTWCRACLEDAWGPWCDEDAKPCSECAACPDEACAQRGAREAGRDEEVG